VNLSIEILGAIFKILGKFWQILEILEILEILGTVYLSLGMLISREQRSI